VIAKKEIYGDDLMRLLDAQSFVRPEIDWTAEDTWPSMEWTREGPDRDRDRGDRRDGERMHA
jgi:hypothetical protein